MPDFDDSYLLAHTINLNTKTVINQRSGGLPPVLKDGACAAKPVNTRGQISDQFRLRKMRLGTVGDIAAMTAEQFTGLFGSDYMRVVGNRLRKNGLDFRPVEDSALYREGGG